MTTLGQMVERVRHRLGGGYSSAAASLESAVTAADTEIKLTDVAGFSRGVAEIGLELIRVNGVNAASRTLNVPAWGRGYRGTRATSHEAGAEIQFDPTWPRPVVAEEINGVLHEIYPDLYAVRTHETAIPSDRGLPIDVPADAIGVIRVYVGDVVRPDVWHPEDRWGFDPDSSAIGRPLRLGGLHRPGTLVRVVYAVRPGVFDLTAADVLTHDFAEVTGLHERVADIVALGVASRMAPFLDVNRLAETGAEARADAPNKPVGQATSTARLLYSEFRARVEQERRVLNAEHPIRVHRAR